MKQFIKKILIWGTILLALAIVLDAMVSVGLRRSGIRKYVVWSDIFGHRINADLVVIGSSRAWCGYNTYLLDTLLKCNSYNLGIDGHQLEMQLIRYETYRRFNHPPKVILVNTDFYSTLSITADERYEREQFFPFFFDRKLIKLVARAKHFSLLEQLIPFLRYFGYRNELDVGMASFWGKSDFPNSGFHKGYKGCNYPWSSGTILDSDTTIPVTIDSTLIGRLDSFASKARAEGIRVFFIKSPVYSPLLRHIDNVNTTDSIFCHIAERNRIPLLDFYHTDYCQDTSFFYNPSHLNENGSSVFTTDLCQKLLQTMEYSPK